MTITINGVCFVGQQFKASYITMLYLNFTIQPHASISASANLTEPLQLSSGPFPWQPLKRGAKRWGIRYSILEGGKGQRQA